MNGLTKQLSDDYIYEVMQHDNEESGSKHGDGEEEDEMNAEEQRLMIHNKMPGNSTSTSDWDGGLTFIAKGSSEYLEDFLYFPFPFSSSSARLVQSETLFKNTFPLVLIDHLKRNCE